MYSMMQAFQRRVARPLAEAEQRGVGGAAAVQPGGGGVDEDLVEIVVAVPFQPVAGHAGLVDQGLDDLGDAPRQCRAGIGHAEAHRVAEADLDVDAGSARDSFISSLAKGMTKP